MYNPWVSEETVRYFLSRRNGFAWWKEIKDALGIWTGKRQFRVQLKEQSKGHDSFAHQPAAFTIGRNSSFLIYAGQPRFCRKFNTYGHVAETCTQTPCRNCSGLGHSIKDCQETTRCNLCNSEEHLARNCPEPKPYASVLKDNMAPFRERGRETTPTNCGEDMAKTTGTDLRDIELVIKEIRKQQTESGKIRTDTKQENHRHTEETETAASTSTLSQR
eukprot:superscaffoldBa00013273_g25963